MTLKHQISEVFASPSCLSPHPFRDGKGYFLRNTVTKSTLTLTLFRNQKCLLFFWVCVAVWCILLKSSLNRKGNMSKYFHCSYKIIEKQESFPQSETSILTVRLWCRSIRKGFFIDSPFKNPTGSYPS